MPCSTTNCLLLVNDVAAVLRHFLKSQTTLSSLHTEALGDSKSSSTVDNVKIQSQNLNKNDVTIEQLFKNIFTK